MKIIAIEEHFLTQKYIEYLFTRKEWPRREYIEVEGKKVVREWWSATNCRLLPIGGPSKITDTGEGRLKEMDETGIDMQVLSLSFPGVERFEGKDGTYVSKMVNDENSNFVKRYPARFAGMAALAPQEPEAAAEELERAVKVLGLKGAMINGNIRGEYLDEKKYWVIFAKAEKLDVPVYIHPGMPSPEMIKPYTKYPGLAGGILGFAAETSMHAMRLILSGLFDKYPNLKIILGHLGEAIPLWLWRIDSRWQEEQVDPASAEFYKYLRQLPSEYFRNNFYVTTSGMFWPPALKFVQSVLGPDRILFASDYPYEDMADAARFIKSVDIEKETKETICHLNAEKLFKL